MEIVLVDLMHAERNGLDPELPSVGGPRAMLRTRLAQLPAGRASFFSPYRISGGFRTWTPGLAGLAAVILVAGFLAFRHPSPTSADLPLPSADHGVLPNRALTPGAARQASLAEVCSLPHEEVVKQVSLLERQRVFAEYGIPKAQSYNYEVDYLITPGLGGEDDIRNLWPEPYNAATWNAHTKDDLEERLHEMVCSHQLDLSVAQEAISTNWIAAYEKYVQEAPAKGPDAKTSFLRACLRSMGEFWLG